MHLTCVLIGFTLHIKPYFNNKRLLQRNVKETLKSAVKHRSRRKHQPTSKHYKYKQKEENTYTEIQ